MGAFGGVQMSEADWTEFMAWVGRVLDADKQARRLAMLRLLAPWPGLWVRV